MARGNSGTGRLRAVTISVFLLATALLAGAQAAGAATGGAATPTGSPPPPPTGSGSPDGAPAAGNVSLVSAVTAPRKSFYFGVRDPRLRYEIDSDRPDNDLRIDVVGLNGEVVRSFFRNDVAPGEPDAVRWNGMTREGRPARNGRYTFRIVPQTADPEARRTFQRSLRRARKRATSSDAGPPLSLRFSLFGFAFPVLGPHDYGQAGARFGAGRSGHTHQGQDVMARCGTPLVAARGGRVRYSGYQGAAGNYVVIDGRGTGFDTAYMHMLRPSTLKKGDVVRTGQPIGVVGSTGSSTACHLHFEIWTAPGWYEGGSPIDPLGHLQKWDRYS